MANLRCEYCRHFNLHGAENCEECEFPLGFEPAAGWADAPFGQRPPTDHIPSPPFGRMGDVVSPMLFVLRRHFTLVGVLVLVTTVPEVFIRYGAVDLKPVGSGLAGAGMGLTSVKGWLLWLLWMASTALLSGSLTYAVVDLQRTGRAAAGECLSRGLKAFPRLFPLTVLYTLLTLAGYVLLVVPGVLLSLTFAVCVPAAVVEGLGPFAALQRSHELTKGDKGLLFMTYFLWGLLVIALTLIVHLSFRGGAKLDLLPTMLLQTAVAGMLNSSMYVLTVYVYLGLLRERRSGFKAGVSG